MVSIADLLAEAAGAERQATAIWARINAASDALPSCPRRGRPVIPAGMDADAQRASDLMRHARALRAQATPIEQESAPTSPPVAAPPSPPPSTQQVKPSEPVPAAARTPTEDQLIDAIAARIAAA